MLVHTVWYGTFILEDMENVWKVTEFISGPREVEALARELAIISDGGVLDRELKLIDSGSITHVSEGRVGSRVEGAVIVPLLEINVPGPEEKGYDRSLIVEANIMNAKTRSASSAVDRNILSAVGSLTDMDTSLNLLIERVREWYVKYWPEIEPHIEKESVLLALMGSPVPAEFIKVLKEMDKETHDRLHASLPDVVIDEGAFGLSITAGSARSLMAARRSMEDHIEEEMSRIAPNLSMVVGPLIGARLIHAGGGLQRMARLPASTIQVLGAETAFFKFLKEGGKPPKHGVLFQHPWVHSAPRNVRGRIARTMASSAALAARLDANGGSGGEKIRADLEKKVDSAKARKKQAAKNGGRQPPFREGWWAGRTTGKRRPKRNRGRRKK